ncbi:phytoene desaturase family protein [Nitriliruptor alkaliphilus]|uniref:phytoene desaturase family protein n=1 Tax=Nitriliruptor alkaliphilus TaxID=427918 RepID=UPI000AE553A2|nr:NAD(P)/FAD-dependent oxidoreductase [Nitriliruptor alkaliphilus]
MAVSPARTDAVVVGAGPNGLAAALTLAREGFRVTVLEAEDTIGGGARSRDDLTLPGLLHDVCSAIHPFGAASAVFGSMPLERHGLRWAHPEIAVAHPLDDGQVALKYRDLDRTVAELGEDGPVWDRLLRPVVRTYDAVASDLLGPVIRVPRHPIATGRAGALSLLPATATASLFPGQAGKALFGGVAAHAVQPLHRPLTTSVGLLMAAAGHRYGWPAVVGGSRALVESMASYLRELGGQIHTGVRVTSLRDLPPTRVALLDVGPRALAEIAGDALPEPIRRRNARWRYGPGAFKVDYAVRGGVPWAAEAARRSGTVHVIGSFAELVEAEQLVHDGVMPERPFVLAAQQHLMDPDRAVGDVVPFWAYAHVPNAYAGDDALVRLEAQLERFAPGFGDRVVARHVTTPADLEAYNPNNVGGDIAGGVTDPLQLIARPRLAVDPYRTGVPGLFLCSSSTPPGGGVHGLCGHHAARSALRTLTA